MPIAEYKQYMRQKTTQHADATMETVPTVNETLVEPTDDADDGEFGMAETNLAYLEQSSIDKHVQLILDCLPLAKRNLGIIILKYLANSDKLHFKFDPHSGELIVDTKRYTGTNLCELLNCILNPPVNAGSNSRQYPVGIDLFIALLARSTAVPSNVIRDKELKRQFVKLRATNTVE